MSGNSKIQKGGARVHASRNFPLVTRHVPAEPAAQSRSSRLCAALLSIGCWMLVVGCWMFSPAQVRAANMRFGPYTNYDGTLITNTAIVLYAVGDPAVDAAGNVTAAIGLPTRITVGTDGMATNSLQNHNFFVTNALGTPAYFNKGYCFRAPQDSGPTVYSTTAPGILIPGAPGAAYYLTLVMNGGTNGTLTFNQITNGLGYAPLPPASTNGYLRFLQASNLSAAISLTYSNTLYSDYTTKLAIQSALSITNIYATNAPGVSWENGRAYVSTNYDPLGTALALAAANTNFSLSIGLQATNHANGISNVLGAAIGSAGISAITATNIATNQVYLGTNALGLASGLAAFRSTNTFDVSGAATAATNALGVSSGLSAFVSTNRFEISGAGSTAATAATNAMGISSGLSAFVSTNRFITQNYPLVWTNNGTYSSNATGWTFQGLNGLFVDSNAVLRAAFVITTNRDWYLMSNGVVTASNNVASGNFTSLGRITGGSFQSAGTAVFGSVTSAGTGLFNDLIYNSDGNYGDLNSDGGWTASYFVGDGSSITNLKHGNTVSISSGGTVTPSPNDDGSTNFSISIPVAAGAITNAIGTNKPTGALVDQTFFYPTNDLSVSSNALRASITATSNQLQTAKADTNSPTIFTPKILGGAYTNLYLANGAFLRSNNAAPFDWEFHNTNGTVSYGTNNVTKYTLDKAGNITLPSTSGGFISGRKLSVSEDISAAGTLFAITSVGQISDIYYASGGTGLTNFFTIDNNGNFITNDLTTFIANLPNSSFSVLRTNGFATGTTLTNLTIQGNVSMGRDGGSPVFIGGTNYIAFTNSGSGILTNGAFVWVPSLNLLTNYFNGAILTNNGSQSLAISNGVTLYSLAGTSFIGTWSAVSGVSPNPTSFYTEAASDKLVMLGYWSKTNQDQLFYNATNSVNITASNNFVSNLGGYGTNDRFFSARLLSTDAIGEKSLANNGSGMQFDFASAAFGQANTNVASGYGAAILSGATNRLNLDGGGVIVGGLWNSLGGGAGNADVIIGGASNTLSGIGGIGAIGGNLIGAGYKNTLGTAFFSSILGGTSNSMNGSYAAILGGWGNTNLQDGGVILGGRTNRVNGLWSVAAGRNVTISHDNVFSTSDGIADTSTTNSQIRHTYTNGMALNGPLYLGSANTNSGIYYLSNSTPFSLWAVTNSMPNFAFWQGQSNGILVTIYYSNGVPFMKNNWP